MSEAPPQNPEPVPEAIPTPEEIMEIFKKLIGSKEYTSSPKLEDEKGIYRWEIRVETDDGYTEYEYNRAGPSSKGNVLQTAVYATFYGKDGMPISGCTIARLTNNIWATESELPDINPAIDYKALILKGE